MDFRHISDLFTHSQYPTMAARPPPARPHIGLNPSFNSRVSTDWGEDDAWDSASDSESPRQSTIITNSWASSRTSSTTSPKPVPQPTASSSNLAFSYTHLNAPSPSSYPPRPEAVQSQKSGWTIVRKSSEIRSSIEDKGDVKEYQGVAGELDEEGEMIVGELEPEEIAESTPSIKPRLESGMIREDVDEIVNGASEGTFCSFFRTKSHVDPLRGVSHRPSKQDRSPRRESAETLVDRETSEKLIRERSIRTNRRHKFVDCLSSQDVNIGIALSGIRIIQHSKNILFPAALRKLAWAGIPNDLRPMAWQLLLVSR